jgi:hypothetical protein
MTDVDVYITPPDERDHVGKRKECDTEVDSM